MINETIVALRDAERTAVRAIEKLQKLFPDWPTGYLLSRITGALEEATEDVQDLVRWTLVDPTTGQNILPGETFYHYEAVEELRQIQLRALVNRAPAMDIVLRPVMPDRSKAVA